MNFSGPKVKQNRLFRVLDWFVDRPLLAIGIGVVVTVTFWISVSYLLFALLDAVNKQGISWSVDGVQHNFKF